MDTKERARLKAELKRLGIEGEYLNSWQAREDLYLHIPQLNNFGKEVRSAGTTIANQPSIWDHKLRMARRGVLPFRPSRECKCKGCRERDWDNVVVNEEGHISVIVVDQSVSLGPAANPKGDPIELLSGHCLDCDFVVKESSKNPASSLRFHRMAKHNKVLVAA